MQILTRRLDKTTILDISGDIDLAHSTEVRKATVLSEFREKRTPRVILNLCAVNYIDSSGVASLVEGLKASRAVALAIDLVWAESHRARSPSIVETAEDFLGNL